MYSCIIADCNFNSYESKPADSIQKSVGSDFVSTATAALTSLRGVNKTDVKTLGDRCQRE